MLSDAAQLLIAIALLVAAVTLSVLVWRRGWSKMSASFGSTSVSLEAVQTSLTAVDRKVDRIDKAVNNVPEGHPPLVERVATLEVGHRLMLHHQKWERAALCSISDQLGITLDALTELHPQP